MLGSAGERNAAGGFVGITSRCAADGQSRRFAIDANIDLKII